MQFHQIFNKNEYKSYSLNFVWWMEIDRELHLLNYQCKWEEKKYWPIQGHGNLPLLTKLHSCTGTFFVILILPVHSQF